MATKSNNAGKNASVRNSADSSVSSIVPFTNFNPNSESMETFMNTTKDTFEKFKNDAASTSRQGFEACAKSGNVLAQGMEQWFKTCVSLAQNSAERQGEAFKQLLACKTLNEVTETQNKIAQDNFEELMQATTKLSEISIKIATEVFEPINEEVSKNIKKASEKVAA